MRGGVLFNMPRQTYGISTRHKNKIIFFPEKVESLVFTWVIARSLYNFRIHVPSGLGAQELRCNRAPQFQPQNPN